MNTPIHAPVRAYYMVEMDMPHAGRLDAWQAWYEAHVARLLALPGFLRAQRFHSIGPDASPWLAIYELADAGALASPEYTARAGPRSASDWAPFMTNWRRNLFHAGAALAETAGDEWLAVWDRFGDAAPAIPAAYGVFEPAGLERTVVQRGVLTGRGTPPVASEGFDKLSPNGSTARPDGGYTVRPELVEGPAHSHFALRVFRPLGPARHPHGKPS